MKRLYLVLLLALSSQGILAQELDPPSSFNDAWYAYVEARDSGKKKPMVDSARVVLDIAQETFEPDDERLPLLMTNYGTALSESGDTAAAQDILKQGLELAERIHGKKSDSVIPVMMAYADALAEIRNSSAQDRYYRKALKITEKTSGKDSIAYAENSLRAGIRILEMSRTTSGKRHLQDAYEIYAAQLGETSDEAGLAAFYLGKTEYAEGDFKDATEYTLLALNGLQQKPELHIYARALLVQTYERRGMSDEATEHCLAIGRDSMIMPDQDYKPLFRATPSKYPGDMLSSGTEGRVDIEFTVDELGFVRDPVVINLVGGKSFEEEALATVLKFRYAPRFVDGEPVAVDGIKTRITFRIPSRRPQGMGRR